MNVLVSTTHPNPWSADLPQVPVKFVNPKSSQSCGAQESKPQRRALEMQSRFETRAREASTAFRQPSPCPLTPLLMSTHASPGPCSSLSRTRVISPPLLEELLSRISPGLRDSIITRNNPVSLLRVCKNGSERAVVISACLSLDLRMTRYACPCPSSFSYSVA